MTPKELDERIYAAIHDGVTLAVDGGQPYLAYTDEAEDLMKQLIRDCIEAVTPERLTPPTDKRFDTQKNHWFQMGHNSTIDTIESNTKELLGDNR